MDRSRSLHNFSLPPTLRWGYQKQLGFGNYNWMMMQDQEFYDFDDFDEEEACISVGRRRSMKLDELGRSKSSDGLRIKLRSPAAKDVGFVGNFDQDEIAAEREKLLFECQAEFGKMKEKIFHENWNKEERRSTPTRTKNFPSPVKTAAAMAIVAPSAKVRVKQEETQPPPSNGVIEGGDPRCEKQSTRLRRNNGGGEKKNERARFSVSLSRSEIEEDFMLMTGRKMPRKPTKRPRTVQNKLDAIFPGLWLTEVTADQYKVNENGKA